MARKLQLGRDQRLDVRGAPDGVAAGELGDGANPAGVLVFVTSTADVERVADALAAAACDPGGLAWAAYPKRSSGIATDLTRDRGWDALADRGLRPVRQVAIDDGWSALRFRRIEHVRER